MPTHDYEEEVEKIMKRVQSSESINPHNKELINGYSRDLKLDGISPATQQKYLAYLAVVAERVQESHFDEMDKGDVKDLIAWVQDKDLAESTVETYKEIIRQFWKWMNDGEATEEVAWMTINSKSGNGKLPKDLLTKEDIEKQIEACNNARDRALVAMLYETGARIGELIDLTVGDIEDRKHGRKVVIDGKTGSRRLPLVESVPYINKWLNDHPNPEKDAPLWCKIQQGGPDDQLGYRYILDKILKASMERADIDKPSNPHHYRHSRASYLANEMTESQLCEWFGWVQGSDVPAKYVHLSGRDIDNAYDEMHGLYEPEEDEEEPDVIECPRCSELNESGAKFCLKCGFALDRDAAEELEAAESETTESADMEDVELALRIAKAMRQNPDDVEEFLESIEGS